MLIRMWGVVSLVTLTETLKCYRIFAPLYFVPNKIITLVYAVIATDNALVLLGTCNTYVIIPEQSRFSSKSLIGTLI